MERTPVKIRAIYADTDAMGVVYHTNYIRWFEAGRTELFRDMGILYGDVEKAGFNLPLTQVYCHYLRPAHYDELVVVETEIVSLRRASIKFSYRIWDENHEKILTEGYSVHACTGRDGKVVRIPDMISMKIKLFYNNLKGD